MPLSNLQPSSAKVSIDSADPVEAEARLNELSEILVDAVTHGASVNFIAGLTSAEGQAFWRSQLLEMAMGQKQLLIAEANGHLVGTLMLAFAHQPNAPHRAELSKLLVHSSARRQGLGRRLLTAAEEAARNAGRTLLLLDTEIGSGGDALYRSLGWVEVGRIPEHSYTPDGRLAETTLFYKSLGSHRHPPAAAR